MYECMYAYMYACDISYMYITFRSLFLCDVPSISNIPRGQGEQKLVVPPHALVVRLGEDGVLDYGELSRQ